MPSNKEETKKRILEVTTALINKIEDPDKITIRQIAEEAGVGIGLINYHFTSRENLIYEAVSSEMQNLAISLENVDEYKGNPLKYLKGSLIHMSEIAMKNQKLNKISAEHDLLKGDFKICLYLLPILREIFDEAKTETELRLIAFQIIITTQSIYLRNEAFHMLTGINIESKTARDSLINLIVDNIVK